MRTHREMHGAVLATTLLFTLAVRSRGVPTAAELLRQAATNMTAIRTVHFTFAAHTVTPGFRLAALIGGDGNLIAPDRFVFNATMQSTPALTASAVMVTCGPDHYVEMGDGNFQKMQGLPDVRRLLFAPDTGLVTSILTQLEQVSQPQAAQLDTAATWHLTGTVPSRLLATFSKRTTTPTSPLRAGLWIGQHDLRLRQMTLSGPIFDGDSAQTTRTLTFSHFNESLPLTVPRGTLPCGAK